MPTKTREPGRLGQVGPVGNTWLHETCLYASLRVLAYRNHIHGGYVLDVATLTAGKKHDRPGQLLELPKFGGKSSIVSNIDQRLRNPERMLVPSPARHR